MTTKDTRIHEGGVNVFADLGQPDADNHFLKAQIVAELFRLTTERKLTQQKSGALMGISQPEVSRLFKGHFREYSVDRLMTFSPRSTATLRLSSGRVTSAPGRPNAAKSPSSPSRRK